MEYICDLHALNAEERGRYHELVKLLGERLTGISELPVGFAISFPTDPETTVLVGEFITYERRCCPFLSFSFSAQSGVAQDVLALTGPDPDVKPFIQAELGSLLEPGA